MRCVITAGPTYEPLDEVRRLTNFSTGRLGAELGNFLAARGHQVTLLLGEQATWAGQSRAQELRRFTTTTNLRDQLRELRHESVNAVFHAAAVSDFGFGKIWQRSARGDLVELKARKLPSRLDGVLAELVATPKIIGDLRRWYPQACLVGWKYEVEGDRARVIALAKLQIASTRTDACVANGPAYGQGFGLVTSAGETHHQHEPPDLFAALEALAASRSSPP